MRFFGDVWLPVGSTWKVPDVISENVIFNLEGPITERRVPAANKICLATDPDCFDRAFPRRPLAACLANNHILDYGEAGLEDTIAALERIGVLHFGAGTLENRCNNPLCIPIDGTVVALMAYVCPTTNPIWARPRGSGVAPIDVIRIGQDIATARERGAARIVVCLHWGEEEVWLPRPQDIRMASAVVDLGADLVVGHHAHCRQPVYISGRRTVFFGIGNAHFPDFEYRVDGNVAAWARQRWWNRRTTIVHYWPRSGAVEWPTYAERAGHLKLVSGRGGSLPLWRQLPRQGAASVYFKKYRMTWKLAMGRLAISRFLARPRWPALRSLGYLTRVLLK